jgi:O-antigen ligase
MPSRPPRAVTITPMTTSLRTRTWLSSAAGCLLVAYLLVVGTYPGEQLEPVRIIGSGIGLALVILWIREVRRAADRVDLAVVVALLLFLAACVLSSYPRQSLDAGTTAIGYAAAFSLARRIPAHGGTEALMHLLGAVVAAVAIAFALVWAVAWQTWLIAYDGRIPALDIELPGSIFGYRHHLPMLCVLGAPGVVAVLRSGTRSSRTLAAVAMAAMGFVILAAGSRTVWVAIAAAVIAVSVPRLTGPVRRRVVGSVPSGKSIALGAAGLGALVLLALVVVPRLGTFTTVVARLDIWRASVEAWSTAPFQGHGPGAFPFLLRDTSYFESSIYAPRHPDNALVELAAEAGLLGLGAAIVLVVGVGRVAIRSDRGRWSAIAFGVMCLGANPSEFGFLVAPLLLVVGLATPLETSRAGGERMPLARRLPAWGHGAALAPIIAAFLAVAVAGLAHDRSRDALADGDIVGARSALESARALDPGLVLYAREAGWLALLDADADAAEAAFEAAVARMPTDAAAWRGIAVARLQPGSSQTPVAPARTALALGESDLRNQLLLAAALHAAGDDPTMTVLGAVQQEPMLVADPAWGAIGIGTPVALLDAAADAFLAGQVSPVHASEDIRAALLALLTGREALADVATQTGTSGVAELLLVDSLRCERGALDGLGFGGRHSAMIWNARLVITRLAGGAIGADVVRAAFYRSVAIDALRVGAVPQSLAHDGYLDTAGYNHRPLEIATDALMRLPDASRGYDAFFRSDRMAHALRERAGCPTEVAP